MNAADLRAWRAELGLTQEQAADLLDIAPNTLRSWEQRDQIQHARILGLACAALLGRLRPYQAATAEHAEPRRGRPRKVVRC